MAQLQRLVRDAALDAPNNVQQYTTVHQKNVDTTKYNHALVQTEGTILLLLFFFFFFVPSTICPTDLRRRTSILLLSSLVGIDVWFGQSFQVISCGNVVTRPSPQTKCRSPILVASVCLEWCISCWTGCFWCSQAEVRFCGRRQRAGELTNARALTWLSYRRDVVTDTHLLQNWGTAAQYQCADSYSVPPPCCCVQLTDFFADSTTLLPLGLLLCHLANHAWLDGHFWLVTYFFLGLCMQ
jgi:hypothetical protein